MNWHDVFQKHQKMGFLPTYSAGLTIVANVAIATCPALLGATWSFVLNFSLLYARVDIIIYVSEANSQKGVPHMLYKNFIR